MSSFQIYGERWEFDYYTLPAEENFTEALELTEVYRFEGKQKIQYDGDHSERELTELAEKALAEDREY